jgi:hypothetical protein
MEEKQAALEEIEISKREKRSEIKHDCKEEVDI